MNTKNYKGLVLSVFVVLLLGLGLHQFAKASESDAIANTAGNVQWEVEANTPYFRSIDMLSTDEGWLADVDGRIYYYDGTQWTLKHEIEDSVLYDIDMVSATDGWAVGMRPSLGSYDNGAIWHYDGTAWQLFPSPATEAPRALEMLSPTEGWAFVNGEGAMYYNGVAWQFVSGGLSGGVYDLAAVSSDDVWAVGNDIFHYDGTGWVTVTTLVTPTLYAVDMLSATEGWAVGGEWVQVGGEWSSVGVIMHYNGSNWSQVPIPAVGILQDVFIESATDIWAVGREGAIVHYDGTSWQAVPRPTTEDLSAVFMLSATDGWAVGWELDSEVLLHYDGSSWQSMSRLLNPSVSPTSQNLADIDMVSATDAWAVGGDWQGEVLLHYDGSDWLTVTHPATQNLYAVDMLSSTSGWVVGGGGSPSVGTILYYNGASWQAVSHPATQTLYAIDMLSPTNGWAVGGDYDSAGTILHYDGVSWQKVTHPATQTLYAVDMLSPTEGWAVGGGDYPTNVSTILRYDGVSWQKVSHPATYTLYAIDMVSPTDGWAVGENKIMHYDGSRWRLVSFSPPYVDLYAIQMVSPDEGWAVGNQRAAGVILHYSGGEWRLFKTSSTQLEGISMLDSHTGRIVGDDGLILKLTESAETYVISGTITDTSGVPVDWVFVETDNGRRVKTDSRGAYALRDLAAGTYTLTPFKLGYTFAPISQTVTVPPSATANFTATLAPTGHITGRVTGTGGVKLQGIAVMAYVNKQGTWYNAGTARTDANGDYTLIVPVGTYRVYFADMSRRYRNAYYNDASRFAAATDVTITAAQTESNVDAALTAFPEPQIAVSGGASTSVDRETGRVTIRGSRSRSSVVTITRMVTCTGGSDPTSVALLVGTKAFSMTDAGGNQYSVALTIPDDLPSTSGDLVLKVRTTCDSTPTEVTVGRVVLYDPSGQITDGEGNPVENATVNLYHIPYALPDKDGQTNDCRTIETRPGGPSGDWSGVPPAAIDDGAWFNPAITSTWAISPTANPQVTGSDGRYGWDVSEGCWYVVVQAEGYNTQVSPLVGVPPAVTDLDLSLAQAAPDLHLSKAVTSTGQGVGGTANLPPRSLVTYTLTLNNAGEGEAQGMHMTDTLPAAVEFGGWLQRSGALPLTPTRTITWSGVISAQTAHRIRFTAVVTSSSAFMGQTITNTATFTSANAGAGMDHAAFSIKSASRIYLPLVLRNG